MPVISKIIRDSIVRSKSLRRCTFESEKMWPRFLLLCDDHGCFEIDTEVIRGAIFPRRMKEVSEKNIEKWLKEYAENGMLFRWKQKEKEFGFYLNHEEHCVSFASRRHKRQTPEPPKEELDKYVEEMRLKFNLSDQPVPQVEVDDTKLKHMNLLFEFWNRLAQKDKKKGKKTLAETKVFTPHLKELYKARLGSYSFKSIGKAIANYRKLLGHKSSKWTHRWNQIEFLQRGKDNIQRFSDWGTLADNYIDGFVPSFTPKAISENKTLNLVEAQALFDGERTAGCILEVIRQLPKDLHGHFFEYIKHAYPDRGHLMLDEVKEIMADAKRQRTGLIKKEDATHVSEYTKKILNQGKPC